MPFEFAPERLSGLSLITPRRFPDERGEFFESYKESDFRDHGITQQFVQDNESVSAAGVLRGLHYQVRPNEQGKLLRVVAGSIFDVAVDIRQGSETFGRWQGFHLSAETPQLLWVPAGFAHGFLALEDGTRVQYKCTAEYAPESERSVRYDDPRIGIEWPVAGTKLVVSDKDRQAPLFADAEFM